MIRTTAAAARKNRGKRRLLYHILSVRDGYRHKQSLIDAGKGHHKEVCSPGSKAKTNDGGPAES